MISYLRRRSYARRHGYFWIRCPRCHRHFGGHETFGSDLPTPGQPSCSKMACWRCVVPVEQQVAEQEEAWGYHLKRWDGLTIGEPA